MKSPKAASLILTVGVALACVITVAPADTDEPSVDVSVVYGATRSDAKSTDVAATVYTVDQEDIEATHATHVEDLLRTIPGVQVIQQGAPGGVVSVFTRGGNSNETLVVVDGIRINNPMTGLVDLANLTVNQVRKIEFVKGPFTTLYGSDAMSGVIYVFTKSGAQMTNQVSVGAGNFGTTQTDIALGGGEGERGWAVTGSWLDSDGTRDVNSDYNGFTTTARLDTPLAGGVMTLSGRYQDYDHGIRGPVTFASETDRQSTQSALGSLAWKRESVGSRDTAHFGIWNEKYDFDYTDWAAASQHASADPTYLETSWQHDFLMDATEVNVGLEFKHFEGDYNDTSMGAYSRENDSRAAYAQVQHRVGDWRLVGGARFEDDNLFSPDPTWRVGATRLLNADKTGVWANYGTAFRAPTLNDMFFPGSGNADLLPETSDNWEVGLWDTTDSGDTLQVVAFHNSYEHLIQWAPTEGDLWQPSNIGAARTHGVEVTLTHKVNSRWYNEFGVSTLNFTTSGAPLLRRPRLQASATIGYNGKRDDVRMDAQFVGHRWDAVGFTNEEVESYLLVNLAGQHEINDDTSAWLRVNNLFDQAYEAAAGYPSPGFMLTGGFTRNL